MKQIIDQFASFDLFGRDNYEYYARVTGRVLRVKDEWICSFRYPDPPRGNQFIIQYNTMNYIYFGADVHTQFCAKSLSEFELTASVKR